MVAIEGLLLLHVPPGVASVSVDEVPMQNDVVPVMGAGKVPETEKVAVT